MKKVVLILFAVCSLLWGCSDDKEKDAQEPEVSLFDSKGKPVAYIDYTEDDPTIYMWDGMPVAYINGEEVRHFNGRFLGWYRDSVLYNREGYAVGARGGVMRGQIMMNFTFAEPVKHVKHVKPVRGVPSIAPVMPFFRDQWDEGAHPFLKFFLTQVTWYDRDGVAVAYLDYGEEETVYLWDGTPVAYLEGEEKVYRFDGRFLGWYFEGIVYDLEGYGVAAEEGVLEGGISMITPDPEPVKGIQDQKPAKDIQALAPVAPDFENEWSDTSLADFFK